MNENLETISEVCMKYPLHFLVWNNDYRNLEKELVSQKHDKEFVDPRGRSPLMLAVTLGHLESAKVLLRYQANVSIENADGFTVVQEATATGDPELLGAILEIRDVERYSSRVAGIPQLLGRLKEAPDFYVEMKWEFTSWVPLVSKMCPSDTYRVYKSGSNVRVDTTLLGFDQTSWQRGSRSYIFKGQVNEAVLVEVDHETQQVHVENMQSLTPDVAEPYIRPHPVMVANRLTTPIITTHVDTDKITFERDQTGIWGWRSDRSDNINGHDCKVFSANNVELVTKTRTEHLTEADKRRNGGAGIVAGVMHTPIHSFLNIADSEKCVAAVSTDENQQFSVNNPCNITAVQYFDADYDLNGKDIGRPKEQSTKVQKFKAHLWLAEDYPLQLQEQLMPIVDLMAISSSHFAKLKHFIQMQLPSGFPVKIEIPLFHVLTARITFGNIFGLECPHKIPHVTILEGVDEEHKGRGYCTIDEEAFEPPRGYLVIGGSESASLHESLDEDEALLQYALQQSLHSGESDHSEGTTDTERVDIWEALQGGAISPQHLRPEGGSPVHADVPVPAYNKGWQSREDTQLQRAIEESLALSVGVNLVSVDNNIDGDAHLPYQNINSSDDLSAAILLSQRQQEEDEWRRRAEEEEILQRVLQLSLQEQ